MKPKIFCILGILMLFPLTFEAASEEFSLTGKWRIEQAAQQCEESDNKIQYKEYWGGAMDEETREAVCMAERFADQVVGEDSGAWLKNGGAVELIKQCKVKFQSDKKKYFSCLYQGVHKIIEQISRPCKEMAAMDLWSETKCKNLISYIFIQKFEKIRKANDPLFKRIKLSLNRIITRADNLAEGSVWVRNFLDPVAAIMWLLIFVLDVILLSSPGNWMKITKVTLVIGPFILYSSYVEGGIRFLLSGTVVIIFVLIIIWTHCRMIFISHANKKKCVSALP